MVDQYEVLESTGQFRFTPPVHTMLALKQALIELEQEGGISARAQRSFDKSCLSYTLAMFYFINER